MRRAQGLRDSERGADPAEGAGTDRARGLISSTIGRSTSTSRDEVFHNQWQAYRTREKPMLATQSDWHEYPEPGPLRDRREDHRHLRQRHDEARRGPRSSEPGDAHGCRRVTRTAFPSGASPAKARYARQRSASACRCVARTRVSWARRRPRGDCSSFWFADEHRADDGHAISLLLLPARGRRDVHLPDRDRAGPRVRGPPRVRRARHDDPAR